MDARGGGYGAIGELLHRYLTGLILAMVVEVGTERSAKIVKSLFRRQQEERFLPGLQKLGWPKSPMPLRALNITISRIIWEASRLFMWLNLTAKLGLNMSLLVGF